MRARRQQPRRLQQLQHLPYGLLRRMGGGATEDAEYHADRVAGQLGLHRGRVLDRLWLFGGPNAGLERLLADLGEDAERPRGHGDLPSRVPAVCALRPARGVLQQGDQCLRVWHVNTWLLEQHLHELRCDRSGLRRVTFSASGQWLIAVSSELTVWRVCVSPRTKKFDLQLHQRLEAICGAESVRTATFSSQSDVVAVGSHDGILGLWNKHPGLPPPPDAAINEAKAPVLSRGSGSQSESTLNLSKFTRMQKITPEGVKPLRAENQKVGNWARAAVASPLPLHHSRSMGGVGARLSLVGTEISGTASGGSTTNSPESTRRQVCKTSTLLGGWQPSVLDEVFSQAKAVDPGLRPEPRQRRCLCPTVSSWLVRGGW
ncbi:unnamed protein product [Effrenium voratum]|nr:unnamed protein product [Effrenium voratum]